MILNLRSNCLGILAAAACIVAGSVNRASADVVTVGQLGTINMTAGTQTANYTTVPIFDASGAPVALEFWQLAIQIVPIGAATGTVSIDGPSRAYPATSILPPGDRSPSARPQMLPGTPAGDVFFAFSADENTYPVTSGGQSLIDLKFNASAGALGDFDIRLVQTGESTYWSPGTSNQPFYVNGVPLPIFSNSSGSLGTISVSAAAVPEPSSLLLSGSVVGLAAWRARRKRRKAADAAPPAGELPAA